MHSQLQQLLSSCTKLFALGSLCCRKGLHTKTYPIGTHVFISRAIQTDPAGDKFAKKLRAKLEAKQIPLFSDKAPAGSLHIAHYERGARTSKVFVPILTTEFFRRHFTMRELDLALAARELSKGRTMLIPIVKPGTPPGTFRDAGDTMHFVAQDNAQGHIFKVDTGRWQHNLETLRNISWEECEKGESEETFLERCAEFIARAMDRGEVCFSAILLTLCNPIHGHPVFGVFLGEAICVRKKQFQNLTVSEFSRCSKEYLLNYKRLETAKWSSPPPRLLPGNFQTPFVLQP